MRAIITTDDTTEYITEFDLQVSALLYFMSEGHLLHNLVSTYISVVVRMQRAVSFSKRLYSSSRR
jgi:hypothetical protein